MSVFQNFIHLSFVPPPEANKLLSRGHQANALTAALCSLNTYLGLLAKFISQMLRVLSLEPLASWVPSKDHLSPQTSLVCSSKVETIWLCHLMSWLIIFVSRLPVVKMFWFHAKDETRCMWPPKVRKSRFCSVSQISIVPLSIPIDK